VSVGKMQVAVIGATGYSGYELVRLLRQHSRVSAPLMLHRSPVDCGSDLADLYPGLSGDGSYPLHNFSWALLERSKIELLFLATPHEVSRQLVPEALARGLRVIDLSGAWRLHQAQHRAFYGFEDENQATAAELLQRAVYGLPELNRHRLPGAALVANPGCYATSVILGLAPLFAADLVNRDKGIVCDSKSGVSGAGKEASAKTHFVSVADNFSAYALFEHRHVGEILEQLHLNDGELTFTPHLLPIPRGILSTIYVHLRHAMKTAEVQECFAEFYRGKHWLRVFTNPQLPQIQFSLRTNYCDLGFCLAQDETRLIVISCLDNLLKGASGKALQNMNAMYGWDEKEGLG